MRAGRTTRQHALLELALAERGMPADDVEVDHPNGRSWANGTEYGLIYPDSFFEQTGHLAESEKALGYFFRGYLPGRSRRELLDPYMVPGSIIEHSDWGRKRATKDVLDVEYFTSLASAEFGLCPHHLDWSGPWDTLWTYRFIDCCLVGAIPVLFRETPLCDAFVGGFRFAWNDDPTRHFGREYARHNRALASERFRL